MTTKVGTTQSTKTPKVSKTQQSKQFSLDIKTMTLLSYGLGSSDQCTSHCQQSSIDQRSVADVCSDVYDVYEACVLSTIHSGVRRSTGVLG